MSTVERQREPEIDIERWYSGYLSLEPVQDHQWAQLLEAVRERPSFDVTPRSIELEYRGRDTSRVILKTLLQVARAVRNADGEVQCQVTGDGSDVRFEFYRIRDGRLLRQRGHIVRAQEEAVTEEAL